MNDTVATMNDPRLSDNKDNDNNSKARVISMTDYQDKKNKPVDPNPNPRRHPSNLDEPSLLRTTPKPTPFMAFWQKAILTTVSLGIIAIVASLAIWLCSFILGTVF